MNVIHKSGMKKTTTLDCFFFKPGPVSVDTVLYVCFVSTRGAVAASLILCRIFCLQLYFKHTKKYDLNNLTSALCLEMLWERVAFTRFITPALVSVTGHLQGELNNNRSVP